MEEQRSAKFEGKEEKGSFCCISLNRTQQTGTIIKTKLLEFNDDLYEMLCFTIMPNHVHLLLRILEHVPGEPHQLSIHYSKSIASPIQVHTRFIPGSGNRNEPGMNLL